MSNAHIKNYCQNSPTFSLHPEWSGWLRSHPRLWDWWVHITICQDDPGVQKSVKEAIEFSQQGHRLTQTSSVLVHKGIFFNTLDTEWEDFLQCSLVLAYVGSQEDLERYLCVSGTRLRMGKGWMPGGLCAPVDRRLEAKGILKPLCFLTIGTASAGMWGVFCECSALAFDFNSF